MKQLSVFIDESGDFSFARESSEYYLITLVFHDQKNTLDDLIEYLNNRIRKISPNVQVIHTGPIIRKKDEYSELSLDDRRNLIYSFQHFIRKAPIKYHTISIKKKECKNHDDLVSRLSKELNRFVISNLVFFQSYEQIIVYYDNGQQEIKNMVSQSHLNEFALISMGFSAVDIAKRVGHESITITLRYAHMFPNAQSQMIDRLNTIMRQGEDNEIGKNGQPVGDGLWDIYELQGMIASNGRYYYSSPSRIDSDGMV